MTERNYREEDEREEFLSLRAGERRAICFILDMSKEHQASFVRWKDVYHSGLIMAASDIFSHMDGKAARIVHAAKYGLDDELYGFVLPVSRFLFLNDLVRSFVGMTFASVRLFGGEIRPYACSIYLATISHPRATSRVIDEHELTAAIDHLRAEYGTYPPTYYPPGP